MASSISPVARGSVASADMHESRNFLSDAHRAGVGKAAAPPRCGRGTLASSAAPTLLHSTIQNQSIDPRRRTGDWLPFRFAWRAIGVFGFNVRCRNGDRCWRNFQAIDRRAHSPSGHTNQAIVRRRLWLRGPLSTQPRPRLLQGPLTSKELSLGGLHTFGDIERCETRTVVRHSEMLRDNAGKLETPGSRATRNSSLGSQSRPNSGRFLARLGEVPVHRLKAWLNAPASE